MHCDKNSKFICLLILFLSFSCLCHSANPKLLLITGCGRSGTGYIVAFLNANGLDINHEDARGYIGRDGCVSWPMLANSLSSRGPIINEKYIHVFHQVRHPLNVITSWFINLKALDGTDWVFIRRHVPEIHKNDSLIVQCAKYWYYWNLKAEKIAEWRYRIEDIDQIIPEFERRIGVHLDASVLATIPRDTNTWTNTEKKVTWRYLK